MMLVTYCIMSYQNDQRSCTVLSIAQSHWSVTDWQLMKIEPWILKQIVEQAVPVIKLVKYTENKNTEKAALPVVGTVHVKAPAFDENSLGDILLLVWTCFMHKPLDK